MHTWKSIDKNESSIDEENVNGNYLDSIIIASVESCVECTLKVLISTGANNSLATKGRICEVYLDNYLDDEANWKELQSWLDNIYKTVVNDNENCISVRWFCSI